MAEMKIPIPFPHRYGTYCASTAIACLALVEMVAASPYSDAVLADGPMVYYRFEEAAGTIAADSSGNATDASFANPGGFGFAAESAEPSLGKALDFAGGHVSVPNLGVLAASSVELWIFLDAPTAGCCTSILSSDAWNTGALHLNLTAFGGANSVIEHAVNGDALVPVRTTAGLSTGTWYHLLVTNDIAAGQTVIYLNGTAVSDSGDHSTQATAIGFGGGASQIGAWAGSRLFDGRMDEFAIYDHALSPERVQAHFAAASAPLTPSVLAFTASDDNETSGVGIALPAGGGDVTLAWEVDRADTVEIDRGALAATASGSGSVTLGVVADTNFTLTATNAAGSVSATVEVRVDPVPLDPRLSEFMAENDGSLLDGDGSSPDWIEIHNPNRFALDLDGYQLSDRTSTWSFPAGATIPALGYLVVFASGDNAADAAGNLHTNFSLDNAGEPLALRRADGSVIDEFAPAFPEQFADTSFGFYGDPPVAGYFVEPTPGRANGDGFASLLDKQDDTRFAFGRGFYTVPFDETITATTPGASIIYTTDGSLPSTANGTRVDPPDGDTPPSAVVPITNNTTNAGITTLRAIVVKAGSNPTNVDTQTYLFSSAVPSQSPATTIASGWPAAPVNGQEFDYGMNLARIGPGSGAFTASEVATSLESIPTLSLVTEFANLTGAAAGIYVNALNRGRDWERPVSVELIYPDGFADRDGNADGFQIDAGLRIRGGFSRNPQFLKHGFRLFFRGDYGDKKLDFPLFGSEGVGEFDKVDLRSSSNFDWAREANFSTGEQFSFVRDVFCRDTQGAMGQAYTRSRYYHLYLNGAYWGIYQTEERPDASFGASYFGGDAGDFDTVKCSNHVGGFTTEATDGTLDVFRELWERAREIGLRDPSDANFFALEGRGPDGARDLALPVLLDVDNLIDYMLVTFWSGNGDGVLSSFLGNNRANNWFGIRNRNGDEGFRFFAHDGEFTLGTSNSESDRTGPYTGSNQNDFLYANPQWIHQDLMANAEYRLRFADRAEAHFFRGGALTDAAAIARLSARADQLRPALPAYAARWADARYTPSYNTGLWETEIAWITALWIPGRSTTVLEQLRADGLYPAIASPRFIDASAAEQPDGEVPDGFQLQLSDPGAAGGGTIYFTTDGSDPRISGAVEPTITRTFLDFADPRAYHVPASATEGFHAAPPLSATPLAYYSFDTDASDGATADGSQDGTFFNGAAISPAAHTGSGALLLDGIDDYVSLGDPMELQITGQISIATWVKANARPSQTFGNILAKGHWLSPNSEIFLRYADQLDSWRVASWDGAVHGTQVAGAGADIGQWVHLVGTYDGSHWNLYRNGVLGASTPETTGAIAVPNDWAIGARGTGTERFFNGFIDEMYLFDTALSPADVAKLYTGSAPEWPLESYPPAAAWQTGSGGHGYDETGALAALIGTDVGAAMQGINASLLTRASFDIPAGALDGIDYLELQVQCDGGFVAYLNGTEVHRLNAPTELDGQAFATAANSPADAMITIDLSQQLPLLHEGDNLLAVHSLNDAAASPDHLIRYQLRGGEIAPQVAPAAVAYSAPITISGPTTIRARVFRDGAWSALTSASFHTGVAEPDDQNLVISQIHYHPASHDGDSYGAQDYEFIELMNTGTQTLDLGSLHLREDVSFDFAAATYLAPGERAQLVASAPAFAERYAGHPTRVLGEFAGNLSNSGGRLHLFVGPATTVRDFSFDDAAPWPTQADGDGFGLVLIHPESNPDHADHANWRRSLAIDANPGTSDAASFAGDPQSDDDRDQLSALLEYALGTSDQQSTPNPWVQPLGGSGSDVFAASITRRINADDVRWLPEVSTDLENWSSSSSQLTRTSSPHSDPNLVTEHYSISGGHPGRSYIRVRVVPR